MKIVVYKNHKKWNIADKEHYGKVVDWERIGMLVNFMKNVVIK